MTTAAAPPVRPQRRALARLHRTSGRPVARAAGGSMPRLDRFTRAYAIAALWSSTDESNERGGEPMDENYTVFDIAPETLEEMIEDCAKFQKDNAELLEQAYDQRIAEDPRRRGGGAGPGDYDSEAAGHDFWLTRNGHGAGFWDRNLGEVGDKLAEAARAWGNYDLYIGDDGQVYGSGPLRHRKAAPGARAGQQQFEVVSGGRTIAHITAPDAESASLDLARGKRGGFYPEDATIKGYRGRFGGAAAGRKRGGWWIHWNNDSENGPFESREEAQHYADYWHAQSHGELTFKIDQVPGWDERMGPRPPGAAARKRKAPRRDEGQELLEGAEGAGESYAHDQVLSMNDWVWDQMIEAEDMRKRDPSSVIPLETKSDYRKLARIMLQDLERDVKRDLDHRMILKMAGTSEDSLPRGVTGRQVVDAFYEGFDRELESDEKRNYLAEEIEHIHEQLRGGSGAEARARRGVRDCIGIHTHKPVDVSRFTRPGARAVGTKDATRQRRYRGARAGGDGGIRRYGPGKFDTVIDAYAYGLTMDGVDEEVGTTETGGWYGLIWLDEVDRKAITKLAADDEKPLTSEEAKLLQNAEAIIFYERTDGIVETEWYERKSWQSPGSPTVRDEIQEQWDRIVREVEGGNGNGNGNGEGDDDFDLQSELETAMVIGDSRSGYSVSLEGKHLEDFKDYDEALKFAAQKMEDGKYWPNVFHVNERGNTDLLTLKVKKNKKGKITKVETEIVRSWT